MTTLRRPCLGCGELTNTSRCESCKKPKQNKTSFRERGYDAKWDRLSAQARKQQPWCTYCGHTHDLTGDHRVPVTARPDWMHEPFNLVVACRRCNSSKRASHTQQDIDEIEALIAARKARIQRYCP